MQFFPAAATSTANVVNNFASDLSLVESSAVSSDTKHASFDSILNSFIEEGRTEYSGRPAGFSAYEKETGTLNETQTNEIIASLRKRNVDEDTLKGLEQLLASGAPLTVSKLFSFLSGESRVTPALEGEERDAFKMLLSKLGFDKAEVEELLNLSDDGDMKTLWKKFTDKLAKADTPTDITKKEFSALLTGLDLSDDTKKVLQKMFGSGDEQKLTGRELELMLDPASKEHLLRDKAAKYTAGQMREAVEEALKAAKVKEQSSSVDDLRGSRRSEQTEAFMQDSVLKKTGAADIKKDAAGKEEEESAKSRRDDKLLFEQLAETDGKNKRSSRTEEKPVDKLSQMLHRVDTSASQAKTGESTAQAQNLNNLAKSFRQEIFSQVENGILQSSQNGSNRLTLRLNPGELGQLTVVLTVRQGELSAGIKTENQDTTNVIREQLADLKASLEAQGIKVKELDVETQLRDNSFSDQWNGHQDHNLMRDSNERDRMLRLARMQRGAGESAGLPEVLEGQANATESTGLHIVA